MTTEKPPKGLTAEARRWWRRIVAEYEDWDSGDLLVLQLGLESLDRLMQARALIDAEGLCVADRFGTMRPHPALSVERDSRAACLRAFKQLGLDEEGERLSASDLGRRAALARWQRRSA